MTREAQAEYWEGKWQEARVEIARLKAWAEDEQRGRHRAEEDRMNARTEIERLQAAAKAFDECLSTDCDGPERDALRAALGAQAIQTPVSRLQAENDKLRTEADRAIRMAELWKEKARHYNRVITPKGIHQMPINDENERLRGIEQLLRAEIARLRGIEQFAAEASRHERDGLRAEVERLKAALDLAQRMLADRERELQAVRHSLASLPDALEPKP